MLVIDEQYLFGIMRGLDGTNIQEAWVMCETLLNNNLFFAYTEPLKDTFLNKNDIYYKLGVFYQVTKYFYAYSSHFYKSILNNVTHDGHKSFDFTNEVEYSVVLNAFGLTNKDIKSCLKKKQNKKQTRFHIITKWYDSPKLQLGLI